uniref:Uncharacterized protein n=1 Tax=Lactuca sativa TaxID=4236 RepID=A0A9R1XI00_LACSA|nr:hypothetical protein LSAT_V11C400195620 [Lactuca sativa]
MLHARGESSHREKKHRKWIKRDLEATNELLVRDYFAPDSLYDLLKFEERFRISRNFFLRIAKDLEHTRGKRGFTIIQKCTTALRQLTYSITPNASDEYLKMSERTGQECRYLFCEYVIELYSDIYLRYPTKSDVEQLYVVHQGCLVVLAVQIGSGKIVPMRNVVNSREGKAPDMSYVLNGNEYKYGYYLADGMYPEYATFVKSYSFPADEKRKIFKLAQESVWKDWHIIKHPARTWNRAKLTTVLTACVILHYMIIKEEGRAICSYTGNDILNPSTVIQVDSPTYFSRVLEIQNRETHHNVRHDLTEHIWVRQLQGGNEDEDKEDEGDDGDANAEVTTRRMKAMKMVMTTSSICLWFLCFKFLCFLIK